MADQLLFSYGTLRLPQMQSARFGRELAGRPDVLPGFDLDTMTISDPSAEGGSAVHPVAVRSDDPGDKLEGTVFALSPEELARTDAFGAGDYLRVKVDLQSGTRAWVYIDAVTAEQIRAQSLIDAQAKAVALFDEAVEQGIIVAGQGERATSDRIRDLANEMFGTTRHWHKRVVRSGPNTLFPYRENPPDRTIEDDDILFVDFGPIFQDYEADVGRTYVLGDDPVKHRLAADLPVIFDAGRRHFAGHPDITGAQLHSEIDRLARESGWTLGGEHAGHLVGEFPHEKIDAAEVESYIAPGNTTPMRRKDRAGRTCHWILEIHLIDAARGFGGFHEQLLDLA